MIYQASFYGGPLDGFQIPLHTPKDSPAAPPVIFVQSIGKDGTAAVFMNWEKGRAGYRLDYHNSTQTATSAKLFYCFYGYHQPTYHDITPT